MRSPRGALALLGLLLAAAAAPAAQAAAAAPRSPEYTLKAAFLFNFTKFVDWPADAFADEKSPLTLCLLGGGDPFEGSLDELVANETVNGRPIAVRRKTRGVDLRTCHILFVDRTERERQPEILASLRGSAVLTVGETDRFLADGGLVNFFLEANRVRFEVNLPAVERTPLKISSKLLRLARLMPEPRR
ncbi:MAG TPA: YfiR family protein [Thermoanaerobaculia bacterium]|nr:YfiR family protein [Thermoanaerobaculia bacterium]